MATAPKIVQQEIADEFRRAWESGTLLDVTVFNNPASLIQAGILRFARQVSLAVMQERELVARCMLHLHPGLSGFVSLTLLTRYDLEADVRYLGQFMVISTMISPTVARTPYVLTLPADQVTLGCLRLHEGRGCELRWTWSVLVSRDDQLHWDSGWLPQRDIRRVPGITPLRKLARDRQHGGPNPPDELRVAWKQTANYQRRNHLREAWGLHEAQFAEAWGARLDLEDGYEMWQSVAAARAMRAYAIRRRLMEELGALAAHAGVSSDQLPCNVEQPSRIQKLRDSVEALQGYYHDGRLHLPDVYLLYTKGNTPECLYGKVPIEDDPFHHEAKRCGAEVLRELGKDAVVALQRATVMIDLRNVIANAGHWIGLDNPIQLAAFQADTNTWEVKFTNIADPVVISDDEFSGCRWNIQPQIVDRSRKLQMPDFEFATQGVVYNLGRWRFAECKSNTPAQRTSQSG